MLVDTGCLSSALSATLRTRSAHCPVQSHCNSRARNPAGCPPVSRFRFYTASTSTVWNRSANSRTSTRLRLTFVLENTFPCGRAGPFHKFITPVNYPSHSTLNDDALVLVISPLSSRSTSTDRAVTLSARYLPTPVPSTDRRRSVSMCGAARTADRRDRHSGLSVTH